MNDVTLTGYEMAMASDAGRLRNISAIKDGRKSKIEGGEWQEHIEGATGEVAAAKLMNVFWGGSVNTFKTGGDIDGTGWEVRTRSKHDYDLVVRDSDPDGRVMILVTGKSPNFKSSCFENDSHSVRIMNVVFRGNISVLKSTPLFWNVPCVDRAIHVFSTGRLH